MKLALIFKKSDLTYVLDLKYVDGKFLIQNMNVILAKPTHCLKLIKCQICIHPDLPTKNNSGRHLLQ